MKLSDGERLITVMLADLMTALNVNGEVDPALIKTLVCGGDDWAIARKYQGLFPAESPDDTVISETTNILWMWGIVEHGLSLLDGAHAEEAAKWPYTSFDGFDGNNDDHYGVAHTMINELGEFSDFEGRNLNSHSRSSLPRYLRMYEKFDRHINAGNAAPLPFEALREICN